MSTTTTPTPVGGTIQHGAFEIESNTETPDQMRETLGYEATPPKDGATPPDKKELKLFAAVNDSEVAIMTKGCFSS